MVSAIEASSFRAAITTVTGWVGDDTVSAGCRSRVNPAIKNAMISPGRNARSVTTMIAGTNEILPAKPAIQGSEIQSERPSHIRAKVSARTNFHRTFRYRRRRPLR
jgi:hypothetical protein